MITYEEKKFRLIGLSPILGSSPSDKEVFTKYIATKAPEGSVQREKALEDVENIEDTEGKETIFYRDENGYPILKGYQIKGFLKAAAKGLKGQIKLAQSTSKLDNFVFIMERNIPIKRLDGSVVKAPDGYLERPLRAQTMQGPRVALAKSEVIDEGWCVDITVRVLPNEKTKTSDSLSMEMVEQLLDYGFYKGLLQWVNGGYGSFKWEVIK